MKRYRTIVADPPWPITMKMGAGGRRARATEVPYSMLSVDDIAAIPVGDMADDDAHLFLWTTRNLFREGEAARVARAWGFEPCGEITGQVTPHTLRHAFGDHVAKYAGLRAAQQLMGHADVSTTATTYVDRPTLDEIEVSVRGFSFRRVLSLPEPTEVPHDSPDFT